MKAKETILVVDDNHESLEQTAELLSNTLKSIGDAVISTDAQGRVLQLNPIAEQLTGWSEAEADGMPLEQVFCIVNEQTRLPVESPVAKVLREGTVAGLANHTLLIAKDGAERPIADSGAPIRDKQGAITGVVLVFRDQTEERRAQNALLESERKLAEAQRMAHLGWWLWDVKTGAVEWSDEVYGIFQRDPHTFTPHIDSILELSPWPEDHKRDKELIRRAIEDHEPGSYEQRFLRPDGSTGHYFSTFQGVYDEEGTLTAMQGTVQDITERKQTEEALRASEATLNETGGIARIGGWVHDLITGQATWTRALYDIIEIEPGSPVPGPDEHLSYYPPEDRAVLMAAYQRAVETGEPFDLELRCHTATGLSIWARVLGRPTIRDGKCIRMAGTFQDITERVVREKQQTLAMQVLATLNRQNDIALLVRDILHLIKESTGFEAVGIRLRDGDDFPYVETNGFPGHFVEAERHLCARTPTGELIRDAKGNHVLECMCGNVLCGRTDPAKPFFTERGSFWTNCTTELVASTTEKDLQSRTRNRCNGEGYESVALIPLRSGDEVIGLLQLNEHRKGMFTLDMIRFFEEMGAGIGIAVARKRAADELVATSKFPAENQNPVLRIDRDGTLLYANPAAASRLADWQPQLGQPAPDVLRDIACRSLDQGSAQSIDIDYGDRVYSFSVVPIAEAGYANLYGRDISEHMQTEEALREAYALTETIVENNPLMIFLKEATDLRFVVFNRAGEELLGYDRKDLLGKNNLDLFPPEQAAHFMAKDRQVLDSEVGMLDIPEEAILTAKKGERLLHTRKVCVRGSDGTTKYLLGISEDITERKQAEAERETLQVQLAQAQKMESVGRLAGGVAHDFNNMLMGIMNYAELCRDKLEPDHPIREWLNEITVDAERSTKLTRQLLALARKQIIAPKVIDLNDAIGSMLKLLRRLIGEDITMKFTADPDTWAVKMDPIQIDQILANLCVNARDAIGGVGSISIETSNATFDEAYCAGHAGAIPGEYALLTVTDSGCGMDKETLKCIFEPFFTTKGEGEGTGLGLATVYGIVKQNDGFINVYSELGEGTTFKIYLPRVTGAEITHAAATAAKPPHGTETVLLVEDEKSVRVTTHLFLEDLGYTVLVAEDPQAALLLAAEHPGQIDLLITDVIMPGMSGRDLANRLLELRPAIKHLFISGFTADAIAQRGILDDGVNFLSKPFGRDVLAHKVREVLGA